MRTLNDPVGGVETGSDQEWTPAKALARGAVHGLVAAAVLAILLAPLAMYLPYMIIPVWLRTPLTFGVAWLLFQIVQRGAGMVGPHCSALALTLAGVVLLSNHVVFSIHGVVPPTGVDSWWVAPMSLIQQLFPKQDGLLIGWAWCHPYALLALSGLPLLLGGGFCAALCNRG